MSSDDRAGSTPHQFVDADLSGARFLRTDLSGAVMRAVSVDGAEIEAPWLLPAGSLVVNGVDVVPLVDAALDRRFPGRSLRRAEDPEELRRAWALLEQTWQATLERVDRMPNGTVNVSVDGEWTFAETLRHLVMATDTWLRRAVLDVERPYHPIGKPHAEYETDGEDMSVFSAERPAYDEVVAVRSERMAMVSDFLADVTSGRLEATCSHPWAPSHEVRVLSCIHTILEEEWEHHRYAVRDLDVIATLDAAVVVGQPESPDR